MVAVPDDPESYDAALAVGRLLAEVAPGSSARAAIHALARELAGLAAPRRRGVLARLRG
jgi:Flp pilus assembly CpaE family ATPase